MHICLLPTLPFSCPPLLSSLLSLSLPLLSSPLPHSLFFCHSPPHLPSPLLISAPFPPLFLSPFPCTPLSALFASNLSYSTLHSSSTAKVMLIHAGGYSQRLPHVSVLGKVFMALPCGKTSGRSETDAT